MRRKIIHAITKAPADEAVYARVAAADDLLGVRFSPQEISWPRLFKREYLPYAEVVWAYLSIRETQMQTGEFDGACLTDTRLVLFTANGQYAAVKFDRQSYGEHALELVRKAAPRIAIGCTPENREKFPFALPTWNK